VSTSSFPVAHDVVRAASVLVLPLFAAHNALWIAHGLRTGGLLYEAMSTPLGRLDAAVFGAAYVAVPLALLGLAFGLGGRQRALGRSGVVFAAVALAGSAVGALALAASGEPPPYAFPVATLAMFASALLVGAAHLRAGVVQRRVAVAVALFGALTLPLGLALPALLGGVAPEYTYFEAHFLFSGAMWSVVGLSTDRPVHAPPVG
jgi:hypothetical protein